MKSVLFLCLLPCIFAQKNPNFVDGRTTIVHLFEWKWRDIADECERFLQYRYGGVQISPPSENKVQANRPWWERYQPVSYVISTRSGNEEEFSDMVNRCNAVGVRIYIDTVINHMTGASGIGTAGNVADYEGENYPAVPFGAENFHPFCDINNYQNATNVRNCQLEHLIDLDQSQEYVRTKQAEYMNHLIDLGIAGFRVDAVRHMWPEDLGDIYSRLKDLSTSHGFSANTRPFIYQEIVDFGGDAITKYEYIGLGRVIDFQYGVSLGNAFKGGNLLSNLVNWGPDFNLLNSEDMVACIDNHDNQREDNQQILTYKQSRLYKMATAFMLAHPYAVTRVMSSFAFDSFDQGPPQDINGNLISPGINNDLTCSNGYVCEHRWRQIFNMVEFRNSVDGTELTNWWSNQDQQIAFGRGNKGFVAFTNAGDLNENLNTGLPAGTYCDVISGSLYNGACSGKSVVVGGDGYANVALGIDEEDGVLAIHINAKVN